MGLFKKQHKEQIRRPHIGDDDNAYIFRRSRTMTGSLSNNVQAAVEHRADLQSDRLKHHTLRRQRRHIALYLMTVIVCGLGIVTLVNRFALSVQAVVDVPTVNTVDVSGYASAVDTYLSSHPNERFMFSLRPDALIQAVQAKFPEVKTVAITEQPWLQPAIVHVVLRQPIASWTLGTKTYYIDEHGIAFQRNYLVAPSLVVEDKTGIDPNSSGAVASERMIHYIGRLVALMTQAGLQIDRLELPPVTSREVDVRLVGRAYPIKTDIDRDPAGQVADIVSALSFLDRKHIVPRYADVRVSSRLYYK